MLLKDRLEPLQHGVEPLRVGMSRLQYVKCREEGSFHPIHIKYILNKY